MDFYPEGKPQKGRSSGTDQTARPSSSLAWSRTGYCRSQQDGQHQAQRILRRPIQGNRARSQEDAYQDWFQDQEDSVRAHVWIPGRQPHRGVDQHALVQGIQGQAKEEGNRRKDLVGRLEQRCPLPEATLEEASPYARLWCVQDQGC